jgi:tetratricopeptide (TPR) repeat protein
VSTLGLLAVVAGLWLAFVAYRWYRDVTRQRQVRVGELVDRAAGRLPQPESPWRGRVLLGLWALALWVIASTWPDNWVAWAALASPLLVWGALKGFAARSLRRGRYASALRMAGVLAWLAPGSARHLRKRGIVLFYAGRLEEAEAVLRKALAQGARKVDQAATLEYLGRTLTYAGRYGEAVRALDTSIRLRPRHGAASGALAEALIWQGGDLERALALTNRARDYEGRTTKTSGPMGLAEAWAVHAWALAVLRREAISAAAHRARHDGDEAYRPQMATVHWRIGMAFAAAGKDKVAARNFDKARRLDPAGLYGSLASDALASLAKRAT